MGKLSPRQMEKLVPLVHRFSLMTYDYGPIGGRATGGVPNSPFSWIRECVEALAPEGSGDELRRKLLMGLPFYGERESLQTDKSGLLSLALLIGSDRRYCSAVVFGR